MEGYKNCDHIHSFQGKESTEAGCLWLGDYTSAKARKTHKENKISTVITAGLGMKVSVSAPITHKLYPLYDSPQQNIIKYFEQSFLHIQEGLQSGNVLVHCYAGVSRSATIVIAYLMKKLTWPFKQALDYVRKKRWVVNPNPGFVSQLKTYEARLKNSNYIEKTTFSDSFMKKGPLIKNTNALIKNKNLDVLRTGNFLMQENEKRGNSVTLSKLNYQRSIGISMQKK